MELAGVKIGLLMNFNVKKLKDGIKRFVLWFLRALRVLRGVFLALKDRLRSFVNCEPVRRNADGEVEAVCYVDGIGSILEPDVDLAAYLLRRGYAVAAPDAPFEYVTLERIAHAQGRGIWSDAIRWRR